jgi:amidase
MSDQIHYSSLLEISRRIRDRVLRSEKVTDTLLQRIARLNPKLKCFLAVFEEQALRDARQADREIEAGFWRGPLHGVPFGVKDILHMKGLATSAGTPVLADLPATEDSTVVARLKAAGAVLMGKLHMTEGAGLTHHPAYPRPTNPWSEVHWTGLSSSGSGVAVAAGLCYGAIGTDTGGSIRMPCAANSLTGIKPTWGRVSRHGLVSLIDSLDHVGPMARSAADAAAILQVIAGADPNDPTCLIDPVPNYMFSLTDSIRGVSIGIDRRFNSDTAPEIEQAMAEAERVLRDLGCRIREIDFPSVEIIGQISASLFTEAAVAHAPYFPKHAERYGPWFRELLENAAKLDGPTVAKGYIARERFRGQMRTVLNDVDMILVPGLGRVIPTSDAFDAQCKDMMALSTGLMRYLIAFNVAAVPTISLPAGFTADGLPIGLQLVGRHLDEALLCAAGDAFQRSTDHHVRHPSL